MYYPVSPTEAIVSSTSDTIFAENCFTGPYIKVLIQPTDRFRFRYKSESGSHGGITGESQPRVKKTLPTVKLENYESPQNVLIKVSLYTADNNPKPHVLELIGKNCQNGICYQKLDKTFCAKFQSMAILNKKKDEVFEILKERKKRECELNSENLNENQIEEEVKEEAKQLNLNAVKLCFEAVFQKNLYPVPGCDKILSNTIFNQKSTITGDLRICRLSRPSGRISGDQEMILLCDRIKKDDIQIEFFEKDDNGIILWSGFGIFKPPDVHHQVAITFKTPAYEGEFSDNLSQKDVWIQLYRSSDGKHGEPRPFVYIPDDDIITKHKKRKRSHSVENIMPEEEETCSSLVENLEAYFEDQSLSELNFTDPNGFPFDDVLLPIDSDSRDSLPNNLDDSILDQNFLFFPDSSLKMDAAKAKFKDMPQGEMADSSTGNPPFIIKYERALIEGQLRSLSISDSEETKMRADKSQAKILQTKMKLDFSLEVSRLLKNKDLLYYASESISVQDYNGNSLLHLAIMERSQNLNFINQILENITEDIINHKNVSKETPLHLATSGRHIQILKMLLQHGGNPYLPNGDGNNCLHLASKDNIAEILLVLLIPKDQMKYSANINSVNYDGLSPLHLAIQHNSKECMELLLNAEADVNIQERKSGKTPLHLAVELQPSLICSILSQPNIDLHAKDYRGYTALQCACIEKGISFEDLLSKMENDKSQIESFLMKLLKDEDDESNCSFHSACESITESDVSSEEDSFCKVEDFQFKIEKYLNSSSNWKRLALLADIDENHLSTIEMLDENPARAVLEKIKKLYNFGDKKEDLIRILDVAGLQEAISD